MLDLRRTISDQSEVDGKFSVLVEGVSRALRTTELNCSV